MLARPYQSHARGVIRRVWIVVSTSTSNVYPQGSELCNLGSVVLLMDLRLVAEMHHELQLKRSRDNNSSPNVFPDVQMPNANRSTSSSASTSQSSPLRENGPLNVAHGSRQWLSIEDDDTSRIYVLEVMTLDSQTVIELFRQYVWVWPREMGG